MNITETKQKGEFNDELKKIITILRFNNYPIELKGSSSLKSQQYYSDYDLFTFILKKPSKQYLYEFFNNLLTNINNNTNLYFLELKIQTTEGDKIRYYPKQQFNNKEINKVYNDIDFIKIDLIAYITNRFIEVSCIYKFIKEELTNNKVIDNLKEDIDELIKEDNYFKALKRRFNIYNILGDSKKLLDLSYIFNGPLGLLYQKVSNLSAIKSLLEFYDDEATIKKVELNLKELDEEPNINLIDKQLNKYYKDLNKKAKVIYNKLG